MRRDQANAPGGDAEGDTLTNIENLIGSDFNDYLAGDGGDNRLTGGAGQDTLDGGGGVDWADYAGAAQGVEVYLAGNTGIEGAAVDALYNIENVAGSAFDDVIIGDASANVLEGGAGADVLDGEGGIDTVSYASSSSKVTVSPCAPAAATNLAGG